MWKVHVSVLHCGKMVSYHYRGERTMRIYSLFDRKLKEYGQLMLGRNDETFIRAMLDQLPRESLMGQHPEDFDLYCLGAVSPESGVIASSVPEYVSSLVALLSVPPMPEVHDGAREA